MKCPRFARKRRMKCLELFVSKLIRAVVVNVAVAVLIAVVVMIAVVMVRRSRV